MPTVRRRLRAALAALAGASRDICYLAGLGTVAIGFGTVHPAPAFIAFGLGLIWAAGSGVRRQA